MKQLLLSAYLLLFSISFSVAQSVDTKKIDSVFWVLDKEKKLSGSFALIRDHKIVYQKSIGFADSARRIPITENTMMRIGSISKTYTATLILKAVELGKLKLETKLDAYFPQIPNASQITIRHLLRHRSGIYNITNDSTYLDWHQLPQSKDAIIAKMLAGPVSFTPDSTYSYSNSNYILLTWILETVFKKSYKEILEEYVIRKLNLKYTDVGSQIQPAPKEAISFKNGLLLDVSKETDMSIPLGAGNIIATPSDILKFATSLHEGKIIAPIWVDSLKNLVDLSGLGVFYVPFGEQVGYGHSGGIDGFRSLYAYYPANQTGFALTTNGGSYNINDVAIALLSFLNGVDFTVPQFSSYVPTMDDLKLYEGVYSSKSIPLKITVSYKGSQLIIQGTNQPPVLVDAVKKHEFKSDLAQARIIFLPEQKQFKLIQFGAEITFEKENH
jgi:D-alanyl-D-alanine carboxypeptidase